MRDTDLIRSVWTGSHFEPDGNHAMAMCQDRLGAGQVVQLDIDPERSKKSHNHQFAFVKTAWDNLPEGLADVPFAKTPESLRKHALIATGFCDTVMQAAGTEKRANRLALFASRAATNLQGYAVVTVEGPVVYLHTPQSQTLKSMGGEQFQASKKAILEWLADLIDVTPEELAVMGRKGTA